nr:MAG TPA: hypothetical protein [Caudoviricetes sp.]
MKILIHMGNYKNNYGGLECYGPYMEMRDKENQRALIEEQYNFLQKQKAEILAQQKYREEQRKGANFEKRLLIFNTLIAIASLLVSIFK